MRSVKMTADRRRKAVKIISFITISSFFYQQPSFEVSDLRGITTGKDNTKDDHAKGGTKAKTADGFVWGRFI